MGNIDTLKKDIVRAIYQNYNQEITGAILQGVLLNMVDVLDALKQNQSSDSLLTASKTIVAAINEVLNIAKSKQDAGDYATNSELAKKANTTYVNSELSKKADTTYVNNALAKKADTTYVNSELGTKASITYTNRELAKKVDKIDGKGLSDENFSLLDKEKLDSLKNYDDFEVVRRLDELTTALTDKQDIDSNELATTAKTIVAAINEVFTTKLDKSSITNELGDSEDKVVSQKGVNDALELKQNKIDNSFSTTNKTVVGAVNETLWVANQAYKKSNTINEFNISAINGTTYDLQGAISALNTYLGDVPKNIGLKVTFVDSTSMEAKTYTYQGKSFVDTANWGNIPAGGYMRNILELNEFTWDNAQGKYEYCGEYVDTTEAEKIYNEVQASAAYNYSIKVLDINENATNSRAKYSLRNMFYPLVSYDIDNIYVKDNASYPGPFVLFEGRKNLKKVISYGAIIITGYSKIVEIGPNLSRTNFSSIDKPVSVALQSIETCSITIGFSKLNLDRLTIPRNIKLQINMMNQLLDIPFFTKFVENLPISSAGSIIIISYIVLPNIPKEVLDNASQKNIEIKGR